MHSFILTNFKRCPAIWQLGTGNGGSAEPSYQTV